MLSDQDMFYRYQEKEFEFQKDANISLIGHSLFDMWSDIAQYKNVFVNKRVANLGISGISTFQYLDIITRPKRIKELGENVFIFLGVNDIVKELDYSPENVGLWLNEIVDELREISPNSYYHFLELTPVRDRDNLDNKVIRELNDYLKLHCPKNVNFIETYNLFCDQEQKIKEELTTDGVHFSEKGYDILAKLLIQHLK
ncbi:acylneuraminate cytidylyltransferase [Bisgaardia hudsonensis]|nr:GDSL-type esterase/lipase family protein [Bisgaardia hudsonensis]QLB13880.1 acylneuraminate cytidylyltransferase [Bisgaardia hudsonensis]